MAPPRLELGEKSLWLFARESTLANWFAKMWRRGQRNVATRTLCPGSIKQYNPDFHQGHILVAPPRENWNYIFDEMVRLSEKLEQLGIDAIMGADNV